MVVGGIGKSGLVGKKVATFAHRYTELFLAPDRGFSRDLGMLKPIDMVILISNSGETDDVNKLIPSLKISAIKLLR
ncbi:SIS domain-containing protein [Mannheimia haemolytica]|nr:SIS domain-containing protein [Mannheimia haemolytica]